ncbi:MAG: hypothetical protein HC929_00015 [Leptolyngbyaceae cyanobacterium SM2_5_2]|nr:hypothetical protein [Leptolyngbyaceae cyanobacterium SM2_5_2]
MSLPMVLWRQDQPQHGPKSKPVAVSTSVLLSGSTDWLVSALVPPVLLSLLVSRVLTDGLEQVGLVSEQLLQGQRLPTLNIHRVDAEADER